MALPPLFIRSATAISPQQSFIQEDFLKEIFTAKENKLFVQDADYAKYISPVAIRRMSRMLKYSISAAMQCLQEAGISSPDGIITGTGNGSVTDMESFLMDMIRLEEEILNPTAFIQSTYNTPNGWIAMQSKCEQYNQCFLSRGSSFELTVLDAQLQMADTNDQKYFLVGCYDEMTERYYIIKDKVDYWRKETVNGKDLFDDKKPGTIAGEGSAFFTVSNHDQNSLARLDALRMIQFPEAATISATLAELLASIALSGHDIDLIVSGDNGDSRHQNFYEEAYQLFPAASIAGFKHLSGEYDTASGFGLWCAIRLMQMGEIPEAMLIKEGKKESIRRVLFLNNSVRGGASAWVLTKS